MRNTEALMNHPILVRQSGINRPVVDWSASTDRDRTIGEDDPTKRKNQDAWLADFLDIRANSKDLVRQTGLRVKFG